MNSYSSWCEKHQKRFFLKTKKGEGDEKNHFDRNNIKGNAHETIMTQAWNVTTINSKLKQFKYNKCKNIDKYKRKSVSNCIWKEKAFIKW